MNKLKHYLILLLITIVPGCFLISERGPVADETVYVQYAWSVYAHGVFGTASNTEEAPSSSAQVAPGIPFYIALIMHLDKEFASAIHCLVANRMQSEKCDVRVIGFKYSNLVILGILMVIIWSLIRRLTSSEKIAWTSSIFILLSGAPWYYADHFLTETLYVPIAMVFCLLFTLSLKTGQRIQFLATGVVLGILALIRPPFFYLFFMLVISIPIILFFRKEISGRTITGCLAKAAVFTLGFILIITPWVLRNYVTLDRAAITAGYGAFTLSSRVSYNRMSNTEYLAAWVYWLPDFGDSLARKLFGDEHTRRLDFGAPDGFINKDREEIRREVSQSTGANLRSHEIGEDISPVGWLLDKYVMGDLFNHIKVTLVLAWRGMFIEKYYGLLGFLVMVWALLGGIRGEQRSIFLLMSFPVIILVFFHAFLTASIPRYNLTLMLPMAFCMAIALLRFAEFVRRTFIRET